MPLSCTFKWVSCTLCELYLNYTFLGLLPKAFSICPSPAATLKTGLPALSLRLFLC